MIMAGSAAVVLTVFQQIAGLHSLDTRDAVERVLSELPSNCQVALVRQRRDGWSYQEIASELQVSVNSVKHYIVLALEHFQVHFSMPAKARLTLKDRS